MVTPSLTTVSSFPSRLPVAQSLVLQDRDVL
ncbi:uncharacterized, partial [Tachysurus ichikawai]